MPQLDFYMSFSSNLFLFSFFFCFIAFQIWFLPILYFFIKLNSNRVYYYYLSVLFISNKNICIFFLDSFFSIVQLLYICNKLVLYHSVCYFFSSS